MSDLEKQLAEANAKIEKLQASLAENSTKSLQTKIDELKGQLEKSVASQATFSDEIKSLKETVASKQKEIDSLIENKAELNKLLESAKAELDKAAKEQVRSNRINTVIAELKFDKAEAEEFVDNLAALANEAFAKQVEKTKKLVVKNDSANTQVIDAAVAASKNSSDFNGSVTTPNDKFKNVRQQIIDFCSRKSNGE